MSSIPKKIMFAISDTGGGHRSAATAIIAALEKQSDEHAVLLIFCGQRHSLA
jgi:UDP-N-acetylglucosamine:LPS N-acetylglucosamine transferase